MVNMFDMLEHAADGGRCAEHRSTEPRSTRVLPDMDPQRSRLQRLIGLRTGEWGNMTSLWTLVRHCEAWRGGRCWTGGHRLQLREGTTVMNSDCLSAKPHVQRTPAWRGPMTAPCIPSKSLSKSLRPSDVRQHHHRTGSPLFVSVGQLAVWRALVRTPRGSQ